MKPRVVHVKREPEANAVYVGRPTRWGNPYVLGRDGSREEVIAKFEKNLSDRDREQIKRELRGRNLACWCAPKACHADVLLAIANS